MHRIGCILLLCCLFVAGISAGPDRLPADWSSGPAQERADLRLASLDESAPEPIRYTNTLQPAKEFFDGRLPHAVGVHHYQPVRANRAHPAEPGPAGFTYNHQPYLAYWKGRFYLQYLAGLVQEHTPPTRTMLMTSENGRDWSLPVVVFPEYALPEIRDGDEIIPAGTMAVMHQWMGFYVAPNGRLLTSGFYGFCTSPRRSPNAGNGLGRVVREVREDGSRPRKDNDLVSLARAREMLPAIQDAGGLCQGESPSRRYEEEDESKIPGRAVSSAYGIHDRLPEGKARSRKLS
ncbi:MAG: hypothetical protein HXY20_01640 [Acidobacteria bacterium]|nr:hypothetical protein [Acidobacteriota bacterium]